MCTHLWIHPRAHRIPHILPGQCSPFARSRADDPNAYYLAVSGVWDGDGSGFFDGVVRRKDVLDLDWEEVLEWW